MYPVLFDTIPVYFIMWACAAGVGIALGSGVAARAGFPAVRSSWAIALLVVAILGGSKLLYLAEARWFPLDDYVPPEMRGFLHGFRIPGGILALAVAIPVVCAALQLEWRRFGDTVIPLAALAVVFIRIGCFLNGCCFGKVTAMPWAVAFPRGSWVFWYHAHHRWLASTAPASLPVHPLQLYFLLATVATVAALIWQQRRRTYSGSVQLLFYALFFGSTAVLEPLRENHLTLNNWLAPLAAVVAAGIFVGRAHAHRATVAVAVKGGR